jgi:amino acid transporter
MYESLMIAFCFLVVALSLGWALRAERKEWRFRLSWAVSLGLTAAGFLLASIIGGEEVAKTIFKCLGYGLAILYIMCGVASSRRL